MKKLLFAIFTLIASTGFAYAQSSSLSSDKGAVWALKTNAVYWATATPNLGAEIRLAPKWTLEAEVGLNPFRGTNDDGSFGRSLKHFRLHPELRYWFCEAFYKHFLGVHIPYIIYNVSDVKLLGTENERHQGWGTGAGISYGYQWVLGKHWNIEASDGASPRPRGPAYGRRVAGRDALRPQFAHDCPGREPRLYACRRERRQPLCLASADY